MLSSDRDSSVNSWRISNTLALTSASSAARSAITRSTSTSRTRCTPWGRRPRWPRPARRPSSRPRPTAASWPSCWWGRRFPTMARRGRGAVLSSARVGRGAAVPGHRSAGGRPHRQLLIRGGRRRQRPLRQPRAAPCPGAGLAIWRGLTVSISPALEYGVPNENFRPSVRLLRFHLALGVASPQFSPPPAPACDSGASSQPSPYARLNAPQVRLRRAPVRGPRICLLSLTSRRCW